MKFPKIFHLPHSPGVTNDDKVIESIDVFKGKSLIFTEKMDGENTCMERDSIHARSENSKDHPSRHLIKSVHAGIRQFIPAHIAIYGENLFAKHSIAYEGLPEEGFLVFAVINKYTNEFLSWSEVEDWARKLSFQTVPILALTGNAIYHDMPRGWTSHYSREIEGYVVRNTQRFKVDEINQNMAKWVRANHVQTDEHWSKKWTPNGRKSEY